jgi:hypothetical protein
VATTVKDRYHDERLLIGRVDDKIIADDSKTQGAR